MPSISRYRSGPFEGDLIMANRLTHHAATAALVATGFWILSALSGIWGQGSLPTEWTYRNYAIWEAMTAGAVLATVVAFAGVLLRDGGRRDTMAIAGIGLAVMAGALLIIGTWAWPMTSLVLAAAALIVVVRLRASGLGSASDWLLAIAWPLGIGTLMLLEQLKVGPIDSYGDHDIAAAAGFALAATMFAIGLASLGARLREERTDAPIDVTHHHA